MIKQTDALSRVTLKPGLSNCQGNVTGSQLEEERTRFYNT